MSLKERLEHIRAEKASTQIDWERKKSQWINSVGRLYTTFTEWFSDIEKDRLVHFVQTENEASEEEIGWYRINELTMDFGCRQIVLQPVGTNIIGASGRVDMFPRGFRDQRVMLLLFRSDSPPEERWEIWVDKSRNNAEALTKEVAEKLIEGWLE